MKRTIKALTGAVGAAALAGTYGLMAGLSQPGAPIGTAGDSPAAGLAGTDSATTVEESAAYTTVARVEGEFGFDQNVITPSDEVFSIFGTIVTALCGTSTSMTTDGKVTTDYWVNIGGDLTKAYAVNLGEMAEKNSASKIMTCSCGTSSAIATAEVTGVPLSDVVEMSGLAPDVNTVTLTGADGHATAIPLSYALENEALLVYQVNGQPLPATEGAAVQLWMPGTTAKYFTRKVANIEFTTEEVLPELEQASAEYRTKVDIMNYAGDAMFLAGEPITFEGYADDYGTPVAAVEFSLDGGEHWTTYDVEDATASKWVYWYFTYTPEAAGTYELTARAVTADGTVSPLAASTVFTVY